LESNHGRGEEYTPTLQPWGIFVATNVKAIDPVVDRMVQAVLESIPDDWEATVAMDYSGGFWERMFEKYPNLMAL
jgi:hypothetical protein